jgi:hypothetical protein
VCFDVDVSYTQNTEVAMVTYEEVNTDYENALGPNIEVNGKKVSPDPKDVLEPPVIEDFLARFVSVHRDFSVTLRCSRFQKCPDQMGLCRQRIDQFVRALSVCVGVCLSNGPLWLACLRAYLLQCKELCLRVQMYTMCVCVCVYVCACVCVCVSPLFQPPIHHIYPAYNPP